MSEKVLCEKSDLVAIADAVRAITGSTESFNVNELSAVTVETVSMGGGSAYTVYIGTTEPTSDIGVDGDIYIIRSDAT